MSDKQVKIESSKSCISLEWKLSEFPLLIKEDWWNQAFLLHIEISQCCDTSHGMIYSSILETKTSNKREKNKVHNHSIIHSQSSSDAATQLQISCRIVSKKYSSKSKTKNKWFHGWSNEVYNLFFFFFWVRNLASMKEWIRTYKRTKPSREGLQSKRIRRHARS